MVDKHKYSGWRRAAHVNSAVLIILTLVLLGFLIASTAHTHGLSQAFLFYSGTCEEDGGSAEKLNVGLHLLLNILSTAIFASSNFFMQVLNSPTRREVDEAHADSCYLGIGVSSLRNAFRVSKFKTRCWVVLLLSSVPIHLLFNSMIFQTIDRGRDYHLTIAAADFVNGASYYPPGASLNPSGMEILNFTGGGVFARGIPVSILDYQTPGSEVLKNISATAAQGSRWSKVDAKDCYNEYVVCNGLGSHRDVIVVTNQTVGWVRNETWHLKPNQSAFWDPMVPLQEPNSLWFSAQCTVCHAQLRYKSNDLFFFFPWAWHRVL